MVLSKGRIEEFGIPSEMIQKEGSYLKEIYDKVMKKE